MAEEKKFYPACHRGGMVWAPVPNPNKSLEHPEEFIMQPMTIPCVPGRCPNWVLDPDSDNPDDGDCSDRIQGIAAQELANMAVAVTDFIDEIMYWQLPEMVYAILHRFGIEDGAFKAGDFDDMFKKREQKEEAEEEPEDADEDVEPDEEPEQAPAPVQAPAPTPAPAPAPEPPLHRKRRGRRPKAQGDQA